MSGLLDDNSLQHYASPYYDPVKAHEYYMQHRVLKGRRTTGSLNDDGKEAWAYTKEQIGAEKKAVSEQLAQERDRKIEEARQNAKAVRKRIDAKLKQLKRSKQHWNASGYKKKVAEDLRKVIAATRNAYAASKKQLGTSYETIYQAEYDKILSEYAKPVKKSRKKKKEGA